MKSLLSFALLAACSLPVHGQGADVQLKLLPQELVQQRLETVSRKIAERRARLQALFEEVGCRDQRLTSQTVRGSRLPNLICTLPGDGPGAGTIVVGAHFDPMGLGVGAVDDWSGVALLPSLYQSLVPGPRRHTFVFVGFAAGHPRQAGAREYVSSLSEPQKAGIRALVNLESLGLMVPQVWALPEDGGLLAAYKSVAHSLDLDFRVSDFDRLMDDSALPFVNARIPVITIHSLSHETRGFANGWDDQLKAIDRKNYYQAYRLAAALLVHLDSQPK